MSAVRLSAVLYDLLRVADDAGRAVADRLGLDVTAAAALRHLIEGGPSGPVDLGRELSIGSAASTLLADRLERSGYVERRPHPADRRRLQLVPTDHAVREVRRALHPLVALLDAVEDQLDERDRAAVARYLTATITAYHAYTRPGTASPPDAGGGG